MTGRLKWLAGISLVAFVAGMIPTAYAGEIIPLNRKILKERGVVQVLKEKTDISLIRLDPMPDGGVCASFDSGLKQGESLTFNEQNRPMLMTRDTGGNLQPETAYEVGVHQGDIVLLHKDVPLEDLADNLMPTITYDEGKTVSTIGPGGEIMVSCQVTGSTPVTAADFDRSVPFGQRFGIEREVAFPRGGSVMTPGSWRSVDTGNSYLILDQQGDVVDVVPKM